MGADDGTVLLFRPGPAVTPAGNPSARGRVLVLGGSERSRRVVEKLTAEGYTCASADSPASALSVAESLKPEAVFVASTADSAYAAVNALRRHEELSQLPILADLAGGSVEQIRALGVDDWVHSDDELTARLEAALKARRLVEKDARSRRRMEVLLEIAEAATSSLELDQILGLAVEKISRVIPADRCSVILVEGHGPRTAHVVASKELPRAVPIALDLARYPELRRAIETRQTVRIEDATRDPMMDEVRRTIVPLGIRSILVQPLICQDDLLGALFLRLSRSDGGFGREETEFAQAVAAALANSVRNARLHQALKRKREDLESAYVDRYRELTEANHRLKELNRLKDEMIAVCSHDMRSPLNVLLGHGRLLLDSPLSGQDRASVEAIVRQGKKILDLVESLLERGKGEQSRLSLEARRLDVAELAKETAEEMEILARQRRVTLRAETPESLLVVGDEVKLREVFQNLITNAIHHVPSGGEVVVRAQRLRRPDGEVARLVVQDNGPGIPPEQIPLVFDRYRHGPGGVGLGLAICREFVDLHGGEIWAESPSTGGCAFVFTLPMVKEEALRPAPAVREDDALPRVLVVEDEPEVAAVVEEIFRSRYRVEVARDGAEGLAKARALRPDLIVMDVFLPKMDGLDAAAALKASGDTSDIPVILLSAHQGVADKLRALNMGAVDYLAKPFQALELLACAERALKLKRTEKELRRSQSLLRQVGSDPETGQLDRGGFTVRLEQELSRAERYGRHLSVALLSPQKPVGDKARTVAVRLRQTLRSPDVVGHLGDGTFVLALPECSVAEVQQTVSRLVPVLNEEFNLPYRVAVLDARGSDAEALLERLLSTPAA
ncbi:MAG: response regulator [Myxococcaceae bacterium]|nr:response regulator [Myxococcaceae bacterium]